MPIVVKALPDAEYKAWLEQRKSGGTEVAAASSAATDVPAPAPAPVEVATAPAAAAAAAAAPAAASKEELVKAGEKVFVANCAACHQASGQGIPPNFPSLVGSALVKGPAEAQIQQVLKGKNLMPPFKHLSDADIAAAITYTRNSWGNSAGVVQAADVAAQRGK
jgi:cytochrome c oxidase subunit 2